MNKPIHVLGFSGSLRKGSFNTALLRVAQEVLPENLSLEIFDLSALPLYNTDLEVSGVPDAVRDFKSRIAAASALLIATPEYNYSVPGVLKNAIDWASRPPKDSPLTSKPIAIMGAGGMLGTVRAQMHLRQILLHNGTFVLNKPEVYVTKAFERFDKQGRLLDESVRQRVHDLVAALQAWTLRLQQ